MLVLSRHEDESIVIGNEIEVFIVRIDPNNVKIGIKAPKHIAVHRKEVYDSIRDSNQTAQMSARTKSVLSELTALGPSKDLLYSKGRSPS